MKKPWRAGRGAISDSKGKKFFVHVKNYEVSADQFGRREVECDIMALIGTDDELIGWVYDKYSSQSTVNVEVQLHQNSGKRKSKAVSKNLFIQSVKINDKIFEAKLVGIDFGVAKGLVDGEDMSEERIVFT